jgi:hypothetical protein
MATLANDGRSRPEGGSLRRTEARGLRRGTVAVRSSAFRAERIAEARIVVIGTPEPRSTGPDKISPLFLWQCSARTAETHPAL